MDYFDITFSKNLNNLMRQHGDISDEIRLVKENKNYHSHPATKKKILAATKKDKILVNASKNKLKKN